MTHAFSSRVVAKNLHQWFGIKQEEQENYTVTWIRNARLWIVFPRPISSARMQFCLHIKIMYSKKENKSCMRVDKREFTWEFHQLSCRGQTRTEVAWDSHRHWIKIWTSSKLMKVNDSWRFYTSESHHLTSSFDQALKAKYTLPIVPTKRQPVESLELVLSQNVRALERGRLIEFSPFARMRPSSELSFVRWRHNLNISKSGHWLVVHIRLDHTTTILHVCSTQWVNQTI